VSDGRRQGICPHPAHDAQRLLKPTGQTLADAALASPAWTGGGMEHVTKPATRVVYYPKNG
jgi:hypothetical protein